jgi:hypothetical protein
MTIFLYIRHSISLNLVSCLPLFYEPPLVQTDCRGDAIGPFSISASRVAAPCLAYAIPVAPSRSAISVLSYCFLFVSVRALYPNMCVLVLLAAVVAACIGVMFDSDVCLQTFTVFLRVT